MTDNDPQANIAGAAMSHNRSLRDRIAEAIYSVGLPWDGYPFDQLTTSVRALFLEQADAVIAALGLREIVDANRSIPQRRYVTDWIAK